MLARTQFIYLIVIIVTVGIILLTIGGLIKLNIVSGDQELPLILILISSILIAGGLVASLCVNCNQNQQESPRNQIYDRQQLLNGGDLIPETVNWSPESPIVKNAQLTRPIRNSSVNYDEKHPLNPVPVPIYTGLSVNHD